MVSYIDFLFQGLILVEATVTFCLKLQGELPASVVMSNSTLLLVWCGDEPGA